MFKGPSESPWQGHVLICKQFKEEASKDNLAIESCLGRCSWRQLHVEKLSLQLTTAVDVLSSASVLYPMEKSRQTLCLLSMAPFGVQAAVHFGQCWATCWASHRCPPASLPIDIMWFFLQGRAVLLVSTEARPQAQVLALHHCNTISSKIMVVLLFPWFGKFAL